MSNLVPTVKQLDREPVEIVEIITPKCVNTYGTAPCTAASGAGGECLNTRATCQDRDNFQARPLTHLTPDRILNQGDTGITDFNGDAAYIVEADVFIPLDPDGCVFEVGGSGTGVYIGFTGGDLVMRAGDGSSATPTGAARLAVDATSYEGMSLTLIAVFEYTASTSCTVTGYYFDPIELELTKIGTVTSSTDPSNLFDTGGYGVGEVNGAAPVGESTEDYNGTISSVRMYDYELGLVGPNLNPNANFNDGIDGWLATAGTVTLSWDQGGGVDGTGALTVDQGAANLNAAYIEVLATAGEKYLFSVDVQAVTGSGMFYQARTAPAGTNISDNISPNPATNFVTAGSHRDTVTAPAGGSIFLHAYPNNVIGNSVTVDNFELRKFITPDELLFADQDAYRTRYFFDDGRKARCSDPVYIMASLVNSSTVGSRINISGADDRYEPLGRLAYFQCTIGDEPHSDYPYDPYRMTRLYDPLKRGTFWIKWLAREKFGRTRALVKRYTGYDGQALADMRKQTYVLDSVSRGNKSVSIKARDALSLTEFRRAQVPAPTDGILDAALTDAATSAFLVGDVTTQYPAAGTLRINDELMTYTARAYNAGDDQTDFTGLTRGTDGSTATAHDVEDVVQNCRRYTAASVSDILLDVLLNDSAVPGQLIDIDKIITEDTDNLGAYSLSTVISEPTGVNSLIGELAESCAFYIWWNERAQKVDMQAIKPLSDVDQALTDEENVIGDSLTIEERPKERVSTVSLYYNPRDFAGDLDAPANYASQTIVASSANNDLDQYAKLPQIREIFSRWISSNAQSQQTAQRYVNRYVDIPIYAKMMVDAKDSALWVGDFVTLSTEDILTAEGERDVRRFLIIEAEEPEPGHMQRLVLSDVTLDGRVYVIAENAQGEYEETAFLSGIAFITDNEGFNPDSTRGATIG